MLAVENARLSVHAPEVDYLQYAKVHVKEKIK